MRLATLFLGGIFATLASAACRKITPCNGKCVSAIGAFPDIGEAFCSSYLSLEVTSTVIELSTATSIYTDVETSKSTETITVSTSTVFAPTITQFARRLEPSVEPSEDATASIISACSSLEPRISSACSCFLKTASITTGTVFESSTSTYVSETTTTTTEISTSDVTAIVSATPVVTIPHQVIPNGGFEGYLTNNPQSILPWVDSSATTGGTLEPLTPLNICSADGYCPGGEVIIRVYPPKTANSYLSISQTFFAKPSTTYTVSYLARCLNYDSTSGIQILYQGTVIGGNSCANGNVNHYTGIPFTTDATGTGELEVRFENGSGLQYLYYYADDFEAVAV